MLGKTMFSIEDFDYECSILDTELFEKDSGLSSMLEENDMFEPASLEEVAT